MRSGATMALLLVGVNYFASDLFAPSSLEALVEELNIPGLSLVAFLTI